MCTYDRKSLLHKPGVPEAIIYCLNFCAKKIKQLVAYTIMPDHMHLLVEVKEAKELSSFLRDFKGFTSKSIKRLTQNVAKYVWQRGTMDHWIRESDSNEDFENHLQYVFFNSVKHLGIRPKDFRYHNFNEVVQKGWLDGEFYNLTKKDLREFEKYE